LAQTGLAVDGGALSRRWLNSQQFVMSL